MATLTRRQGVPQVRRVSAPHLGLAGLAGFFRLVAVALFIAAHHTNAQTPETATVRIAVLSLFHPHDLNLYTKLPIQIDGRPYTIASPIQIHAASSQLEVIAANETLTGHTLTIPAQTFDLEVPQKLRRQYHGSLAISVTSGEALQPIVTIGTELAVASIVQAESPPKAPLEALKAQAVASRSYLLANLTPAHPYDATDTTHDQFLRSPPPANSAAAKATQATAGIVLTWQPEPGAPIQTVAAMYSRSCSGTTKTLKNGHGAYPYYAVACPLHSVHPALWTRTLPVQTAAPKDEQDRIAWNRTHGWESIPSAPTTRAGDTISGSGQGHGVGLCQLGAAEMAAHGASYERILATFYPNTTLRKTR